MTSIRENLSAMIQSVLSHFGYILARTNISGVEPIKLWMSDKDFLKIWNKISDNTMIDICRGYMLYQFLKNTSHLKGETAEVGVWRGGTGQLMAEVLPHKKVYLFDTFEGLPAISPEFDKHFHSQGQFNEASYENVKSLFNSNRNVEVIKGVFPQSIRSGGVFPESYCFVHVDVDLYQPARDCCEFFYERLVPGGVMIFDDYGFGTCPGVTRAVDEFFHDKHGHFYLPSGQFVAMKDPS